MSLTIDHDKISEVLFENSEEFPNYVYIHIMNLMKQYHETKDNKVEIKEYILKLDKPLRIKLKKHIKEPCCICYIPTFDSSCFKVLAYIFSILFIFVLIGVVVYCIATGSNKYKSKYSPPPKNF